MAGENESGNNVEGGGEGGSDNHEAMEYEAKMLGWVPKEEFHGDEEHWIDAETFIRRGKEINPILKKNNERLMGELRRRDSEIAEMKLTLKEFGDMYKKMSKSAYDKAIADVKAQLRGAREDGNYELIDQLEEQRDALVEESKNVKVPGADKPSNSPPPNNEEGKILFTNWVSENRWYDQGKNPDLVYLADGFAMRLSKEAPHLVGTQEFLDRITTEIKRLAPDRFRNPNRASGSPVAGGSSTSSAGRPGGKKTYNDLPPDAKAACDRFVKQIPGYTRETYVTAYFEGEQ